MNNKYKYQLWWDPRESPKGWTWVQGPKCPNQVPNLPGGTRVKSKDPNLGDLGYKGQRAPNRDPTPPPRTESTGFNPSLGPSHHNVMVEEPHIVKGMMVCRAAKIH